MIASRTRAVVVLVCAVVAGACAADRDDAIQLGFAAPLSIPIGQSAHRGAVLAVEEINRSGGIGGRPLELDARDDQMERELAIEIATRFRDEGKVVAVIGHLNSGATIAAADIYNHPDHGLLEISPAATSPELSGVGEWTFRVCPTDLQQGRALADLAYGRLGLRRAAVIYANDEYGRGVLNAFAPAFEQHGGTVVARDPFLAAVMEDETTLDPYLEHAILAGADALVIVGVGEEVIDILRAARRLGYRGAVMGPDGLADLKDAGPIADGVYITSGFLPDRPTEAAQAFVRRFVDRFGEAPRDGAAHAYDAVMLLARAIREVGTDRRALRDYIAGVGTVHPAYEGVTGTIRFDELGDAVGKDVDIGVIRGGQIVTADRTDV